MRVVRWLCSSHYSMVVRCGNQKVMATYDSLLLLCGARPCVERCHYREYNTKRASFGQMAILVSLFYGGWSDGYIRLIALWWGGEAWKPECNCYIRLTTSLWIEVCIRNSSCHPNPNPNGVTPTCCRLYNTREPAKRCNPNLLSVV